jgi:hypothetical protein
MFKSILPSKKVPDADFFMVTSPTLPSEGAKENYPALATTTNTTKIRAEKPKKSKTKDLPMEPVAMEQAFDKLLVSLHYTCHGTKVDSNYFQRMSFRFPIACARGWRQWRPL